MSQLDRECGNCARPVPDGAGICTHCATALAKALRGAPELLDNLVVTYSKCDQLAAGAGGKRGKSEPPLPVRLDVSPVIAAVSNSLLTWARDLVDRGGFDVATPPRRSPYNGQRGPVFPPSSPLVDLACYAAVWIADHVEDLRRSPAAVEAHRCLTDVIAQARVVIDRPPAMAYRGPCGKCGTDLHAAPGAATVVCRRCGKAYDGAGLRAQLLDEAADHLVTTVDLSAALSGLAGLSVPVGTIRSWRSRGQLAPHAWLHDRRVVVARPIDDRDRPLYRVGDAVKLLRVS